MTHTASMGRRDVVDVHAQGERGPLPCLSLPSSSSADHGEPSPTRTLRQHQAQQHETTNTQACMERRDDVHGRVWYGGVAAASMSRLRITWGSVGLLLAVLALITVLPTPTFIAAHASHAHAFIPVAQSQYGRSFETLHSFPFAAPSSALVSVREKQYLQLQHQDEDVYGVAAAAEEESALEAPSNTDIDVEANTTKLIDLDALLEESHMLADRSQDGVTDTETEKERHQNQNEMEESSENGMIHASTNNDEEDAIVNAALDAALIELAQGQEADDEDENNVCGMEESADPSGSASLDGGESALMELDAAADASAHSRSRSRALHWSWSSAGDRLSHRHRHRGKWSFRRVMSRARSFVRRTASRVRSAVRRTVTRVRRAVRRTVTRVRRAVRRAVTRVRRAVRRTVTRVRRAVRRVASRVRRTVRRVATRVRRTYNNVKRRVVSRVRRVARRVRAGVRRVASRVRRAASRIKLRVTTAASRVKRGVRRVASRIRSGVRRVASRVKSAASRIKHSVRRVASRVKRGVRRVATRIKSRVRSVARRVKSGVRRVANKVRSVSRRIGNKVRRVATRVKAGVRRLATRVRRGVRSVTRRVKSTARRVARTVRRVATTARQRALSGAKRVATWVSQTPAKVRGLAKDWSHRAVQAAKSAAKAVKETNSAAARQVENISQAAWDINNFNFGKNDVFKGDSFKKTYGDKGESASATPSPSSVRNTARDRIRNAVKGVNGGQGPTVTLWSKSIGKEASLAKKEWGYKKGGTSAGAGVYAGHVYAGANGKLSASKSGLTASGGVTAGADLVRARAYGSVEGRLGKAEASGSAYVGANVGASGSATIGKSGVKLSGKAEAFAGAKAGGNVKLSTPGGWASVKASGYVSAGAGADAGFDVGFHKGKISLSANLGATLGLGAGGNVKIDINAAAIATAAKNKAKSLAREGVEKAKEVKDAVVSKGKAVKDAVWDAFGWGFMEMNAEMLHFTSHHSMLMAAINAIEDDAATELSALMDATVHNMSDLRAFLRQLYNYTPTDIKETEMMLMEVKAGLEQEYETYERRRVEAAMRARNMAEEAIQEVMRKHEMESSQQEQDAASEKLFPMPREIDFHMDSAIGA